ncbi:MULTISPECIES: GIN domain-containing protein [Flavobacteriaceae]|uniref:GIN domain-containing protein n=1 Tax=Flavobacteriaceae TaxID=49546 RepID=UPI00149112EA|nr:MULTISPECIES: DUF2807 domain-containing protein [Allomuricauda]MDC6367262.1 DUF2807 domain-containing protein [Muricauda sp. AC10]
MKNLILLLIVLTHVTLEAQRKPRIKGSRIVTEVSEELPAFNAVQLNDDYDIILKKSFGPGYRIVADDNLIDIFKFKVMDSTLIISAFYDVTAKKQLDITINYTDLKAITLKQGSISSDDIIESDELFVDGFENTRLNLRASASVMDINLENTSRAEFNVDVDSLNIGLSDRAEAYIYAVNGTSLIDLDGNGSLTFEGTSDGFVANLMGNAKLKAERMEAGNIATSIENSASARIYAYQTLELKARGNSRTYLYGNPQINIVEFMDTAQLLKKEE